MSWKPIDFHGIVSLEKTVIHQLKAYLNEKESQLGNSIVHSLHVFPTESLPVVIPFSSGGVVGLSDAIAAFEKNVRQIVQEGEISISAEDWEEAVREIQQAIWEYMEVLESCTIELFQQVELIGLERWNGELIEVVESLKTLLLDRIDQQLSVANELERCLRELRTSSAKNRGWLSFWLQKLPFLPTQLDRSLFQFIRETRKFLLVRYGKFHDRFARYEEIDENINESIGKFDSYQVFQELDQEEKQELLHLYRLIKLWKWNQESAQIPQEDTVQALRSSFRPKQALELFRDYTEALRNALFERSRLLKRNVNEFFKDVINKPLAQDMISGGRAEIHTLIAMITAYREFFLKTHPNPYVRSRWGFVEWVVGPEPEPAKKLLLCIFELEKLQVFFDRLEESLTQGNSQDSTYELERSCREIEKVLHEMGQPLTTRHVMRSKAEYVIEQLQKMNELGSFNPNVVAYAGSIFAQALRADWQYHVLFEYPLFHQLYEIHQGIIGHYENRHHLNRMIRFRELIAEIEKWVESRQVHRHTSEIEVDMNDMKESLQEFLGYVQKMMDRAEEGKETVENVIQDISLQLLEYRYLFGNFFHHLHQYEPDGKRIRNQFLFVDQYFETVEDRLQELRARTNAR